MALSALDQEVFSLLTKGATETVVCQSSPGFYGRIFVVPKASGGVETGPGPLPTEQIPKICPSAWNP